MKKQIEIRPVALPPGQPDDVASVSGDTITFNGRAFDLSSVPEAPGYATPPDGDDHPFDGPMTRDSGVLKLALRMRYDTATAEPFQPTDPAHWLIDIDDGDIPDLVVRKPPASDPAPSEESPLL